MVCNTTHNLNSKKSNPSVWSMTRPVSSKKVFKHKALRRCISSNSACNKTRQRSKKWLLNNKNILIFIAPINYSSWCSLYYSTLSKWKHHTSTKSSVLYYYSLFFYPLILQHTWSKESQRCKLFATIPSNEDLKLHAIFTRAKLITNTTALTN